MLGLCCNGRYGTMKHHDNRDNGRDNDINKDKNNNDNAVPGSGSDGLIFNLIATLRSRLGLAKEY